MNRGMDNVSVPVPEQGRGERLTLLSHAQRSNTACTAFLRAQRLREDELKADGSSTNFPHFTCSGLALKSLPF